MILVTPGGMLKVVFRVMILPIFFPGGLMVLRAEEHC
jgi:hypothetical protein